MAYTQAPTGGWTGPIISEKWDDATAGVKDTWVKPSTANSIGTVGIAAAGTDYPLGILQGTPAQGEGAGIQTYGVAYAIAGGTIAVGDRLVITTGGKVIADNTRKAAAAGNTTPDYVCGVALSAATNGNRVKMLIRVYEVIEN